MLHTFGMLLSFLTAVVLGAVFLPSTPALLAALGVTFAVLLALTLLLLTGHRRGLLEQALNLLHRVPLLDRVARRLEPKRATLALMDEQITDFFHRRSEEHTSELQSRLHLVCRLLLEKKKN